MTSILLAGATATDMYIALPDSEPLRSDKQFLSDVPIISNEELINSEIGARNWFTIPKQVNYEKY